VGTEHYIGEKKMADRERSIIRLKPRQYIHILDNNTGVTRLEVGPKVITLQDHEILVLEPEAMVVVPPRHYCTISNPVIRDDKGIPVTDPYGQVQVREGDQEIRFEQQPFPLFPGEKLDSEVTALHIVGPNTGLRLRAIRDFVDQQPDGTTPGATKEIRRISGDEWMFLGPGTYFPRIEVKVVEPIQATIVRPNQALRLRARKACSDHRGTPRRAGEEWLVNEEGGYLPSVDEQVVGLVNALILTEKTAIHLQATRTFTDEFNQRRKAGDEWLVTIHQADTHIPDVYETVIGMKEITTLNDREWCVVCDPVDSMGKPQLGKREIRKGRTSFFLHPGESLESGVQQVYVLGQQEALLLCARETFQDNDIQRNAGDLWLLLGPNDYIPRIEVDVSEKRKAIALDKNEGIYVRNTETGTVRLERGPQVYLLTAYEELWQKTLPDMVEKLLYQDPISERFSDVNKKETTGPARDMSRAVTFRIPQGAACQVFDFKRSQARVVFGPDLVMLEPDENFTVLSLSGGRPKRAMMHHSLVLLLGPDFMVDVITVETSDHALLELRLAYNWHFEVDRTSPESGMQLFQVPDYVGNTCNFIASKIRGKVAGVTFDQFHRNQARVIREAVFGDDLESKKIQVFKFAANNLAITNVDIQSVEPVDEETRNSLKRSVQIAIKITTDAQEAAARHDAERLEQEAKARLERQRLIDQREAETERKKLLELQAESNAVEAMGTAAAEARAQAETNRILGETKIQLASQESQAAQIRHDGEMNRLRTSQENEINHTKELTQFEIEKEQKLSEIQREDFKQRVAAIGAETLQAMAQAGPEMQAKLLQSLGLSSVLITDGNHPINLFTTAQGMIAATGTESKTK
jgi:major vault protein